MILVDTSIWVDLLSRRPKHRIAKADLARIATCPPVLQEVLQGVQDEAYFRKAREGFWALPCLGDPVTKEMFARAADLFRSGRKRGLTIRSSTDCLIAAIAIENRIPVWHQDRNFDSLAKFTELEIFGLT
jgi:predicted nucleic acid-binding protein